MLGNKKYKENITKVTTRLQIKDTTTIGRKTSTTFQSSLSSPLSSPLSVPLSVSPLSPVQLFSDECQLCHKHRIQYGNEKIEPTLIVTFDAERKIKENAKIKNETLYNKIKDLDLIATEFKYHRVPCYRDFTRSTNNSKDKVQQYQKGDFATVEKFITNNVIKGHQVISLKALHEMYNLGVNDKRYRYKLKERLERHFGNDIFFLTLPPPTEDCIIIGRKALKEEPLTHCFTQDSAFKYAAETMKNDILTHYHNLGDIEWPPTIEELSTDERKAPRSVYTFLEYLLKLDNKEKDIKLDTLVDSFAQDFLHGVTRGRMITAKHFLMGLGLHNMTGQKNVVDIVNKLGHSISYNRTCEIETAQAEAANRCRQSGDILQLRPETPNDIVLTYFWADNLDKKIDSVDGGGMIHMTTLVAFQEKSINVIKTVKKKVLNIQKSRRLSFIDDMSVPVNIAIDTKKDPPKFDSLLESSYDVKQFSKQYFIWLLSRKQNEFDQVIPNYYGWTLKNRTQNKEKVEKTLEVYLPPINAKVTQFETIKKYLDYLTLLSNSANMPYVNIFLDVGAAMNAYKFIWNNPRAYSTIVLHLGSFHFMKENFLVTC